MIEIILTNDPSQTFDIVLGNINYEFLIKYNSRVGAWSLDITTGGQLLYSGIALVIGGDIMSPYPEGPTNIYMVNTTGRDMDATAENLGIDVRMFQLTDEEVANVSPI